MGSLKKACQALGVMCQAAMNGAGCVEVMAELGRFLIVMGVVLVAVGLLLSVGPRLPGADWIGRLPGDIYIDRPHLKVHVPLATCLLASIVLTLILSLWRR